MGMDRHRIMIAVFKDNVALSVIRKDLGIEPSSQVGLPRVRVVPVINFVRDWDEEFRKETYPTNNKTQSHPRL